MRGRSGLHHAGAGDRGVGGRARRDDRWLSLPHSTLGRVGGPVEVPAVVRHQLHDHRQRSVCRRSHRRPDLRVRTFGHMLHEVQARRSRATARGRAGNGRKRHRLRGQARGVLAELEAHRPTNIAGARLQRRSPRDLARMLLDHEALPRGNVVDRPLVWLRIRGKAGGRRAGRVVGEFDAGGDGAAGLLGDGIEMPALVQGRGNGHHVGCAVVSWFDGRRNRNRLPEGRGHVCQWVRRQRLRGPERAGEVTGPNKGG